MGERVGGGGEKRMEREEEEGYGEFDEVPPPPYSYRHPDYPSACVFRCKALERLLTGPHEVPSDQEVRRILREATRQQEQERNEQCGGPFHVIGIYTFKYTKFFAYLCHK